MKETDYVVLLGDANVDVVLEIDAMPLPGADALARSQTIGVGGSAANTAIMLHRLGLHAELVCCLGQDPWGEMAIDDLQTEGVGLQGLQRCTDHPTSINVVTVTPDHERTMFAHRGASAHLSPDQLDEQLITSAAVLYLSGYALLAEPQKSAALRATALAKHAGIPCVLDVPVPAVEQARTALMNLIPQIELLVIGSNEAQLFTGTSDERSCIAALHEAGAKAVALKLGKAGAIFATRHEWVAVAGIPVRASDTTGAGDSFVAGAIFGLVQGWSLNRLGELANKCGAAAVQKTGAGCSLPSRSDVYRI